uniref:Triosephosphate isomerase, cytosolic n=1 Tax=Davidia involucrata TaxID=16924 RepID=A0A5B7B5J4_DAVIN
MLNLYKVHNVSVINSAIEFSLRAAGIPKNIAPIISVVIDYPMESFQVNSQNKAKLLVIPKRVPKFKVGKMKVTQSDMEKKVEMLDSLGNPWVILGDSEKRLLLNESNKSVGEKVAYMVSQGLKVIACVGETHEQRELGSTMDIIAAQTKAIAERISNWDNVVLVYEPLWAIRTGKVATSAQVQEVHSELRKWLHVNTSPQVAATTRIIYGGFMTGRTCKELVAQRDVDGFLVDEDFSKEEFIDIIKCAMVKKDV